MKHFSVRWGMLCIALIALAAGCAAPSAPPSPAKPTEPASKAAQPAPTAAAKTAPTSPPAATVAQKATFPEKGRAISIVVPFAAGGGTDINTRILIPPMEKQLGTNIEVINKGGAGTQLGCAQVASSKPDGYTLLSSASVANNLTYLDPERKANYGRKSFQMVAGYAFDPQTFVVRPDSPYKTAKDIMDAAKAAPEKVKMGTPGYQSGGHVGGLVAQKAAGVKFAFVHFDGTAPAVTALLGGHIDAVVTPGGSVGGQTATGALRSLGLMSKEQSKFYPGVPTFEAQGYPVVSLTQWGIAAPAGLPKEALEALSGAVKKALEDPDVNKKMDDILLPRRYLSPPEYEAYWDQADKEAMGLLEEMKAEQLKAEQKK